MTTAIAAAAMFVSMPAAASSNDDLRDELEELLENAENEMKGTPAVSEYLGLDELKDTMEDQGFDVKLKAGLSEETAENVGMPEEMAEGSYLEMQVQADPKERQWQFGAGLSVANMDLFNLALYGNHDMLAVSLPQIYENTVGIRSGNLYEQMEHSWVTESGGEIPEILKNVELDFYPEDCDEWQNSMGVNISLEDLSEEFEDILEDFTDRLDITKKENGDSGYDAVYYVEASWENLKELYQGWVMAYLKPFAMTGMISEENMDIYEDSVDQMFAQAQLVCPENPVMEFYVMGGRLDKILCEMQVDMTAVQETEAAEETETEAETEDSFSASVSVGDDDVLASIDRGTMEFEVIFWGESEGYTNADYNVYVKDEEGNLVNSMYLTQTHFEQDTVSGDRIGLMMEDEESTYYCDLYQSSFDSATGEYSVTFSFADDSSSEDDSTVYLNVEGSFSDVVKGQGFVCNFEKCAIGEDFEDVGALCGSISVQAGPGEIEQPQNVEMLFEMTEDQAKALADTIESNINALMGISEEPESEDADLQTEGAADETEESTSDTENAADGTVHTV